MNVTSIEVNTSSLAGETEALRTALSAFTRHISGVYEEVRQLDTMWDGPANEAFIKQFQKDYIICRDLCGELEGLVACMEFAREDYDRCEQAVSEAISTTEV